MSDDIRTYSNHGCASCQCKKKLDAKEVYKMFTERKEFFPHIRFDYVQRKIEAGEIIVRDGVAITFNKYKRNSRLGDVLIMKDDYIIHQIVNSQPGSGHAKTVIDDFLKQINTDTYLAVRDDNLGAIKFYNKVGFEKIGTVCWKNNTLPGTIFVKRGSHDIKI